MRDDTSYKVDKKSSLVLRLVIKLCLSSCLIDRRTRPESSAQTFCSYSCSGFVYLTNITLSFHYCFLPPQFFFFCSNSNNNAIWGDWGSCVFADPLLSSSSIVCDLSVWDSRFDPSAVGMLGKLPVVFCFGALRGMNPTWAPLQWGLQSLGPPSPTASYF